MTPGPEVAQELIDRLNEIQGTIARGIENVRLHEETHLNIAAKTAAPATKLLKEEKDPVIRQKIIDAAHDINEDTDETMGSLLEEVSDQHPLGSLENDEALQS